MTQRQPSILLTRRWPREVVVHLSERYAVAMDEEDRPLAAAELAEAMRAFDAVCPTVTDALGADILGGADPRMRLLANFGVGFEHIDLPAARRAGIAVTNTPDVLTRSTAELAVMLMLMVSRRAGEGERAHRPPGARHAHRLP